MKKITLSVIILAVLSLVAFLFFTVKPSKSPAPLPKNIIVVDVCTTRPDHFSFNGYPRKTTPNLDEFASQSAVFENAWTQANWCLPNISTLFTGARPEIHKMINKSAEFSKLSPSFSTLPKALRAAGYTSAGFVGTSYLKKEYDLSRDFDLFVNPFDKGAPKNQGMVYSLEENLPQIDSWMAGNKDKNKPLFMYVSVDDMHSPYMSDNPKLYDPDYSGMFDEIEKNMTMSSIDIAGALFDSVYNGEIIYNPTDTAFNEIQTKLQIMSDEFKKDPKELNHLIARYDASLNRTDKLIGELFAKIKANGLWDNSIIILTSHQGEYLGEHGLLGHSQGLNQEVLSTPILIHFPGKSGKKVQNLAERIDIPATILDIAGVLKSNKKQFTGNSLLPLIEGKNIPWKSYIFASSKPTMRLGSPVVPSKDTEIIKERAVRDTRYKLTWYSYKDDHYQLFDLQQDPKETKDIKDTNKQTFDDLKKQMDNHVQSLQK